MKDGRGVPLSDRLMPEDFARDFTTGNKLSEQTGRYEGTTPQPEYAISLAVPPVSYLMLSESNPKREKGKNYSVFTALTASTLM